MSKMKNVSPLDDPPPPPDPPHPEKPDKIINVLNSVSKAEHNKPKADTEWRLLSAIKILLIYNTSFILFIWTKKKISICIKLPVRYNKGAGHSHSKEHLIGQKWPYRHDDVNYNSVCFPVRESNPQKYNSMRSFKRSTLKKTVNPVD